MNTNSTADSAGKPRGSAAVIATVPQYPRPTPGQRRKALLNLATNKWRWEVRRDLNSPDRVGHGNVF
jgi:hypothetical protein